MAYGPIAVASIAEWIRGACLQVNILLSSRKTRAKQITHLSWIQSFGERAIWKHCAVASFDNAYDAPSDECSSRYELCQTASGEKPNTGKIKSGSFKHRAKHAAPLTLALQVCAKPCARDLYPFPGLGVLGCFIRMFPGTVLQQRRPTQRHMGCKGFKLWVPRNRAWLWACRFSLFEDGLGCQAVCKFIGWVGRSAVRIRLLAWCCSGRRERLTGATSQQKTICM